MNSSVPTALNSVSFLFEMTINPIERLWGYIKEQLKWLRFYGIEELREALQKELKKLTNEVIASLTGYPFILKGLSVANI